MQKRSVIFVLAALLFLVTSVYVSFADSCDQKYEACWNQCGSIVDCWSKCENDETICDEPVTKAFYACIEPCPNAEHYPTCVNNCDANSKLGHEPCSTQYKVCHANCDTIKACTDSCESLGAKCQEEEAQAETPEETPIETPEETPEEIPTETPKEEEEAPTETPEEIPEETPAGVGEESGQLLSSVTHAQQIEEIQNYYDHYGQLSDSTITQKTKKLAQDYFEETIPSGLEVINAKGNYQDALKKRASKEELEKLKTDYEQKSQILESKLQNDVLNLDKSNPEALWQMGTLSQWEGNNQQAYEYYRDALMAAKNRNPFQYQQLLDSINNPGIRMELLQSMEPNEKVIELPTVETSPFLKGLQDNLKALVQPVNEKYGEIAENIEKISRAFSITDKINQAKGELGISPIGGENE